MFNVTPVRPKQEPRPVILIPIDDGVSEIEGITRDKDHDTITILNPLLHNISRAPLRKPPVGVVVDPKKDVMLKLRDRYLTLKDKEEKKE